MPTVVPLVYSIISLLVSSLVFLFILVPQIKIHLSKLVLPIQVYLFIFVPHIQVFFSTLVYLFELLFICSSSCLLVNFFPLCLLVTLFPPLSTDSTLVYLSLSSTCSSSPNVSSCLLCLLVSFVYLFLLLFTRFFCCILVLFLSSIFPSSRLLAVSPFVYLLFLISSTCCFYSRIQLLFLFLSTFCSSSCLLDFPLV